MEERVCPACGKSYQADPKRLRHGRETTCSRACSYKHRMRSRSSLITVSCICGREFVRSACQVKTKHGMCYCSRACMYAGRVSRLTPRVCEKPYVLTDAGREALAESRLRGQATRRLSGYRHSESTKEKLREATTKQIASTRRAVSRTEDKVAQELTARGIDFRRQVAIRDPRTGRFGACVDFLIDGVAVEVNGTFWHADPTVYPSGPTHTSQWRTAIAYARKRGLLFRLDIPVVEIWERRVTEDVADAVDRALRHLRVG